MFLKVKVFPDSKDNKIVEKRKDSLHIYTRELAQLNRANDAVIKMLSDYLRVSPQKIKMIKGHRTPNKIFEIKNQEELWK